MNSKTHLLELLIAMLLACLVGACDQFHAVDVEEPEFDRRLVVEGYLFASRAPVVTLRTTVSAWDGPVEEETAREALLTGADVMLHEGDEALQLREVAPGRYANRDVEIEPGRRYRLDVSSGTVSGEAEVDVPAGEPQPIFEGRYAGFQDVAVPGTSILKRTHRLEWALRLEPSHNPRYFAAFFKEESWDEPATDENTRLARLLPGLPLQEIVVVEEVEQFVFEENTTDPLAGESFDRRVIVAEVDSVYYFRLTSNQSEHNATLPDNIVNGTGILAGLVADSLLARATIAP